MRVGLPEGGADDERCIKMLFGLADKDEGRAGCEKRLVCACIDDHQEKRDTGQHHDEHGGGQEGEDAVHGKLSRLGTG